MIKIITKIGLKQWGLAFLLALILALIIKGFLLQSYKVQSRKMEQSILKGDYVFVNKLAYGSRLPITLLSLPFFSQQYSNLITLPAVRIPGYANVKVNDVLVFNNPTESNLPIDKRTINIKRCIGVPGDTIQVLDKKIFRNNFRYSEPEHIQHNYRLVCKQSTINENLLQRYGISQGTKISDIGIYEFAIKDIVIEKLKKEKALRYVRDLKDFVGENPEDIFPNTSALQFSKDFFGPVVVPKKGSTIELNTCNYGLYKLIIEEYEENGVEINDSSFIINGIQTNTYKVKNDYYFVLDDNRDNAFDSRYWGFLPESHIIGKTAYIWFSRNPETKKYRWHRSFTKVN